MLKHKQGGGGGDRKLLELPVTPPPPHIVQVLEKSWITF